MNIKHRLYENIMNHLTVEQKKGIVPIVKNADNENKQSAPQQKFEFDLFSLPSKICKKLEVYVQECIAKNQGKMTSGQQDKKGVGNNNAESANIYKMDPLNGVSNPALQTNLNYNQIQNQIDEKLRENNMNSSDYNDEKKPQTNNGQKADQ